MKNISMERRRYLARLDTRSLGHLYTDCLVIGGGIAGLRCALGAAESGSVLVLVKNKITESNTYYAQGGIAAVLRDDDSFDMHIADTLKTGCGLCDRDVVELVVKNAPLHIRELQKWSAPFDMVDGEIACGREGGHCYGRVAHALGDATGKALALCLWEQVKQQAAIKIFEECFCIDLLTDDTGCLGSFMLSSQAWFAMYLVASDGLGLRGAGQLWRETTNPAGATADGLAMAYRAGAVLGDLEFMQFHPTTLYIAGAERTLITEALRGAGGLLVDSSGKRFMPDYHEMAELAPRDVVSRAIYDRMAETHATNVFLDVRHLGSKYLAEHFPTITALCESFDINVDKHMIPVRPSAHYMVGGVKTDIEGRTNIKNLYCCGEAAATGLHGSNRLASNSLLEGIVFGKVIGDAIAKENHSDTTEPHRHIITYDIADSQRSRLDIPDVTNSLRSIMWRNVGLERSGQRLEETVEIIDFWRRYVMDKVFDTPADWQCQNMLTVSRLIAQSALLRRESRGVHFRSDYDKRNDKNFSHHIYTSIDSDDTTSD